MMAIDPELSDRFSGAGAFDDVLALEGKVYRAKEGRRTLLFEHDGSEYFAKIHMGIGWGEIWKNLSSFRWPVIDASNEWRAVDLFERVGVETVQVVGRGARGLNPAKRQSFVIMRALEERVEVEDFLKTMAGLEGRKRLLLKRAIVRKVADAAGKMHGAGVNHRDFYLCHFHIMDADWSVWRPGDDFRLPLIDLHRAQIRSRVPRRWLVKDLGALLFSAIDCGVTDRDVLAFLRVYLGGGWKRLMRDDAGFWRDVVKRAGKFYMKHRGAEMKMPGVFG